MKGVYSGRVKRTKMKRSRDKKVFSRTAVSTNGLNYFNTNTRGGIRL